jgi:hypothetical protein
VVCARSLTRVASACCRAGMFGRGSSSLFRYAFLLFRYAFPALSNLQSPTICYSRLNGLRNPSELRLAGTAWLEKHGQPRLH